MTNLYRHPFHGHLRASETAPTDYVEVSLAAIGTTPTSVAPLYRTLETESPTVWHPQRLYTGAPEQEGYQDGYSNAIIYAYKRSSTMPTDNPGDISYDFSTASITTASLANGWVKSIGDTVGDFSLYTIAIYASSQNVSVNYLAADWGAPTLLNQSSADSITVLLSNPSHAIPTDNAGNNGNYIGSGTEVRVYEGSLELAYDGVGTNPGTWNAVLTGTAITPGSKSDSGNYLTIGNHDAMTADVGSVSIAVSGKRADGATFSYTILQSLSKSKAGADGVGGPTVSITSSRPTTFTYTDGVFDSGQSNITLTATVNNLVSPTLSWTFQGFEVNPTDSTTTTQVITSAQLGVMRSAKVTITANGLYVDTITIVRLDKSTAAAGATRNVYRGAWATGTSYIIGDIVLDANGYGWSCLTAHTSSAGTTTPVYPTTSNANWTIHTIKGDSSVNSILTNETHTVAAAVDGTGYSLSTAGGTFKTFYGSLDVTTSATYAITGGTDAGDTWAKTQNGLTFTLNETTGVYTLSGAAWTSDSEIFTVTSTYASVTLSKIYTISKAKAGAGGATGAAAQYVVITGDQSFKYLTGSATPTSTDIILTASLFGGLTTYSWQYWNGSAWVNLSGTQNASTYTLNYTNAAWSTSTLRVRCLSGSVWDEYSIVKLYDGAQGPQGNTGPQGPTGPTGSTGATGQSARSAYIVTTSASAPVATAGSGDVVPSNVPAGTVSGKGWSFTAYNVLAAGEFQYRIDGLYTPGGNIMWGNAYLNYLKVGTLAALSALLGTVEVDAAGALYSSGKVYGNSTPGFYLGNSGGVYKFDVGDSNKNIRYDGATLSVNGEVISTGNLQSKATYDKWLEQDIVSQPITKVVDSTISVETINTMAASGDLVVDSVLLIDEVAANSSPNLLQLYIKGYKNGTFVSYSTEGAVFIPGYSVARGTFLSTIRLTTFIPNVVAGDVITLEISGQCDHNGKIEVGMMHNYVTLYKK